MARRQTLLELLRCRQARLELLMMQAGTAGAAGAAAAAHFANVMPVDSTLLTVGFCGG